MTQTLEPLFKAISDGDLDSCDTLLKSGVDPSAARVIDHPRSLYATTNISPLGWAAYVAKSLDDETVRLIIELLLNAGADSSIAAPLLYASTAASIELLVTAGADKSVTINDGNLAEIGTTPLMIRAEAQDIDSINFLLGLGLDAGRRNLGGKNSLDYAIIGTDKVSIPADVDQRLATIDALSLSVADSHAYSAAMISVTKIQVLEEREVIVPGPGGQVSKTIQSRTQTSVRPILEKLESFGGLPGDAIEAGSGSARRNLIMLMLANSGFRFEPFDEMLWLIRNYGYFLMDHTDAIGRTAFHHIFDPPFGFALPGPDTVRLVRAFLSYNANSNFRDNSGSTPLHELVRNACRSRGSVSPYPFHCDSRTSTPCKECTEAARLMMNAGADPKLPDFSGRTASYEAQNRPRCPLAYVLPSMKEGVSPSSAKGASGYVNVDELWSAESEPLVSLESNQADDPEGILPSSEDPAALRLHPEATALYKAANVAYLATSGHKDPYIRINPNNGRRSTIRQAQLYEAYIYYAYYGGPKVDKANRPGKSKHEYGFAMDIIRTNDEARLAAALMSVGWEQVVEDEGWHWEAVSATSYSALNVFIATEMEDLTYQWGLVLSEFYERKKERMDLLGELGVAQRELNNLELQLAQERQELTNEEAYIANEERRLINLQSEVRRSDVEISRLERERAKGFNLCPNRNSYQDCTHSDLKAQYDAQIRQLIIDIQRERARRNALANQYDSGRVALTTRRAAKARKETAWRRHSQEVAAKRREVNKIRQAIRAKEIAMQAARGRSTTQLQVIIGKVAGWS